MKHEEVAEAFVAGRAAKNRRLVSDGANIIDVSIAPPTVLATKTREGVLVVWLGRGRSGSVARAAVRRVVARMFGKAPYSWVHTRTRPKSRDELLAAHEETVIRRAEAGLDPIHTATILVQAQVALNMAELP